MKLVLDLRLGEIYVATHEKKLGHGVRMEAHMPQTTSAEWTCGPGKSGPSSVSKKSTLSLTGKKSALVTRQSLTSSPAMAGELEVAPLIGKSAVNWDQTLKLTAIRGSRRLMSQTTPLTSLTTNIS